MNNKLSLTFILTPLLLAILLTTCAHAGWELIPGTDAIGPVYLLESDDVRLYAIGDTGFYLSLDDGSTWRYREVGPGIEDFRIYFIASGDGAVYVGAIGHGIYRSDDGGNTWHPKNEGLPRVPEDLPDGSHWYQTLKQILVTDSGAVIAVGYHQGTLISRNRGDSWDDVTMQWKVPQAPGERDFALGEAIWSMTEFDGYLWAVFADFPLCRSRDEGDSWEMLPTPGYGSIANFVRVYDWAEIDNKLYVAGGYSFGRWNEAELIWEHLSRGLPVDTGINELAVNRDRIFATFYRYSLGAWLFEQPSETWFPTGPQHVGVYSLVSHQSDLYAGTRDGVYRASISTVQRYGKLAVTWGTVKTK